MSEITRKNIATYLPKDESAFAFPVDRTVLLVVDPVNDFLSEGGAGWDLVKATVKMNNVVDNLKQAIEGARNAGIPVLFGPMAYSEEDYAHHQLQRRSGINRIMFENKMFIAGTWGADFHPDLRPHADEIVLLPHKTNDVFETDLPQHLERLGITHLVIAGMTANLCCEATGRHATELGYDVTFLSDAVGAAGVPAYEAAVRVNYPLVANAVIEVKEFLSALAVDTATIQPGDNVRGSDHGVIGSVKEVTAGTDGYLVVSGGLLKKDFYVPLHAVVKRIGIEVFINVPKLVVGDMPWSEPPTPAGQKEKLGPKAVDVENLYGSTSPSAEVPKAA